MTVADVLVPERVVFLADDTREAAFKTLIGLLAQVPGMPDAQVLETAFFEREALMSTGIGMGLGVPHVRLPGIRQLSMAVGIRKSGIKDYPSIDHAPVQIVAMIAAGESQHVEYIRTLAKIVAVLKGDSARQALLAAQSPQEVYDILSAES